VENGQKLLLNQAMYTYILGDFFRVFPLCFHLASAAKLDLCGACCPQGTCLFLVESILQRKVKFF